MGSALAASDFGARLLLVVLVVVSAFLVVSTLRRRSRTPHRIVKRSGLAPGVYFFSSSTCADCSPVRDTLIARLGRDGFVEYSWESDRELLSSLDVEVVPSTMVVDEAGVGTLWSGGPGPMFSVVDP